jgi:hypothetical protein
MAAAGTALHSRHINKGNVIMKNENEKAALNQDVRPLGRITAEEISVDELVRIAGGGGTGSQWHAPLPPTDVDRLD